MSLYPEEQHRGHNKRTYNEMSHSISLPRRPSFSPADPPPFSGSNFSFPSPTPQPTHSRRRTPHPHNSLRASPFSIMLDPRHPPQPSNDRQPTVIDLTDDYERAPSQSRRSSQRATLPPQLERSDFTALEDVISIDSDDDDDEVEIVSSRALPSRPQSHHSRLRLPRPARSSRSPRHRYARPPQPPSPLAPALFSNPQGIIDDPNILFGGLANFLPQGWQTLHGLQGNVAAYMFGQQRAGPAGAAAAEGRPHLAAEMRFHEPFVRPESRKTEHVPPPKAREGFTRSPKEEDVVVCPACDEELTVEPDEPLGASTSAAAAKVKAGAKVKAKSKKDREEHPFWVVRECGHVYCNKCYQNRKPDVKSASKPLFPERQSGAKKVPLCAVEDCANEVGDKKFWVGVFL